MSIQSKIICNTDGSNYTLLDTFIPELEVIDAKYSGSFSDRIADGRIEMTLLQGHPCYNQIKQRLSTITATDNGVEIFHGRPISIDYDIYHRMKVVCECDAKFMEDVPDIFSMVGLADDAEKTTFGTAIGKIFKLYGAESSGAYGYNLYADSNRKIYLASAVPQALSNKEINKPSNSSVYSNLRSWLEEIDAYAKVVKVANNGNPYYAILISESRGNHNSAFHIEYGENVTDYKYQLSSENFYTAIHAIGKKDNTEYTPSQPESPYALIQYANVIYHETLAQQYGKIIYHEEYSLDDSDTSSQTTAKNKVRDKAIESLEKKMKLYETIDISIVDPRLVGYDGQSSPVLGDEYDVIVPLFVGAISEPLTKYDKDFLDSSKNRMTLGAKKNLLSDRSRAVLSTAKGASSTATIALAKADAAATPAQVATAIAQSEGRVGDFIEEYGTTGIWKWRKWHSGDAECWGSASTDIESGDMTSEGSVFKFSGSVFWPNSNADTAGFFISTPNDVQISPGNCSSSGTEINNAFWVGKEFINDNKRCKYNIYRATQSGTVTYKVNIRAIGRWKN